MVDGITSQKEKMIALNELRENGDEGERYGKKERDFI